MEAIDRKTALFVKSDRDQVKEKGDQRFLHNAEMAKIVQKQS